MPVFRVEKNTDYTVMSNIHLRDKALSLKAKGLLSQILSLPEDWDYTLTGLCCINRESKDAIRTAINELERAGYIERRQTTDAGGKFSSNEYVIHETPVHAPSWDKPSSENPTTEKPSSENPTQLNKDISNTDQSSKYQSIYPCNAKKALTPSIGSQHDTARAYRELIQGNIEYDALAFRYGNRRVDEIVELMLETLLSKRPTIRIAGDDYPHGVVWSRFLKLRADHIEYVFDCLDRNTTKISNIKAYLLAALYNAPATIDSYYRAEVNHDLQATESRNCPAPRKQLQTTDEPAAVDRRRFPFQEGC